MTTRYAARRAGFTLVELLVVILIIAVLAALSLAGFSAARSAARKTAAVTEMAQVANAVAAFKAKTNVSFIPAFRPGTTDGSKFRLRKTYDTTTDPTLAYEFGYLRQLFPQIDQADNGWTGGDQTLEPNQALLFFLTGPGQQGFSTNRAKPFSPVNNATPNETRVGPFLETTNAKLFVAGAGQMPFYLDPWGTPYAYFSFDPGLNSYPVNTANPTALAAPAAGATHPTESSPMAPNGVRAFRSGGKFLNQKGFQIVSAGPDQVFGSGGDWAPGTGDYVSNGIGGDDISNFNSGPLNQQSQ